MILPGIKLRRGLNELRQAVAMATAQTPHMMNERRFSCSPPTIRETVRRRYIPSCVTDDDKLAGIGTILMARGGVGRKKEMIGRLQLWLNR